MIGISGAHRTGKTTLAQAFAERYEIPFVKTSASEIFRIINRDPAKDYPLEERIGIQEALLFAFERQYASAEAQSKVWISDRTPIDLASYLLADVSRESASNPEIAEMVNTYVRRCIQRTNQWFSTILLLQPGIELVPQEGKAPCCPAYIEHLNFLQSGILLDDSVSPAKFKIPRHYTNLEDRIDCVHNSIEKSIDAALKTEKKRIALGVPLH